MRQAPIGPSFKLRHGCDCPLPLPRFGLNSSSGRAPQVTAGYFSSMSGSGEEQTCWADGQTSQFDPEQTLDLITPSRPRQ